MTTRSVPAGSSRSACQTIAGSRPEMSRSARAMSRSRLMPGKTSTADFIAGPRGCGSRPSSALFRFRLLDQGTSALIERPECLVARHRLHDLEIVPWLLRLFRLLHLEQIHIAQHPAVNTQMPVLGHEIIDRHLAHLRHHLVRVLVAQRLDRLEIVMRGAVDTRLHHGRHMVDALEET